MPRSSSTLGRGFVLDLVLSWGDDVVAQKRVPFRSSLVPGEHFALPGGLASYVVAFPPDASLGHVVEAGEGALRVRARLTERPNRPPRLRFEGALVLAIAVAALMHAVAAFLGVATPGDDEATVVAERRATADAYVQNAHEGDGTPGTAGVPPPPAFVIAPTPATPGTPTIADEPDPEHDVAKFGMLRLLDTMATTPSPGFDVHGPSEVRDTDLFGDGSWSQDLGGSGVGLSGVGQGGGGSGRGVELVGPVGGAAIATGYGQSHLMGRHVITWRCTLGMIAPTVVGHLEASAIQRVVRQNEGRFRACYLEGLAKNPALGGRVAVKFLIGRDGTVATAEDTSGSDLPDDGVRACVVRTFASLSFPEPGGVVSVTYPFVLSPGD
jgi:hypothetical protein